MKKRVVILVDGQNLYYCLKEIKIIEKDINWNNFFQYLLTPEDELVRTYWFRPQKIHETCQNPNTIKSKIVFKKFHNYYDDFISNPEKLSNEINKKIDIEYQTVENWLRFEKNKFSGIEHTYDQLSNEYEDIEIVKAGVVKVDPLKQIYLGEKGVDISLAVKMISLSVDKKCDKIILVSGDFDYAEAIKYVKNNMTKVHIVKFHQGDPPKTKSFSKDLGFLADKVINIFESELKSNFKK